MPPGLEPVAKEFAAEVLHRLPLAEGRADFRRV